MKLFQAFIITAFSGALIACADNAEQKKETVTQTTQEPAVFENKPATVIPGANGTLNLNAENGAGIGKDIKYMPEWRAFGWFSYSDKVEWQAAVKHGGNYTAVLEWSVSDEEAGKEFILEAGNEKVEGVVEKSGSWETFKTAEIGTIKLEAGEQTITFRPNKEFNTGGALLDLRSIQLTPATK